MAAAFLVVGFLLGFLVGARARHIANKLKAMGSALISLHVLLKLDAAADAGLAAADGMNDSSEYPS